MCYFPQYTILMYMIDFFITFTYRVFAIEVIRFNFFSQVAVNDKSLENCNREKFFFTQLNTYCSPTKNLFLDP